MDSDRSEIAIRYEYEQRIHDTRFARGVSPAWRVRETGAISTSLGIMRRTRFATHFLLHVWVGLLLQISSGGVFAKQADLDVEGAIRSGNLARAGRLIFVEARSANAHETGIVLGQAKAGYVKDAMETIDGTWPASRSWLLVLLMREATGLSSEFKSQLMQDALESARKRMAGNATNYIRSGDLARVSIYFSGQGRDDEAKHIFSEALATATKGLAEESTGGFRQVTEEVRNAPTSEIRRWMIDAIEATFRTARRSENLAFACVDMVVVAGKMNSDLARPFIECGAASIAEARSSPMREMAAESLAKAKNEIGITDRDPPGSFTQKAIREARAGHPQNAYAIVSALDQNLYVDQKTDAYMGVFDDAIHRGDLVAAKYFAERPVRQLMFREIYVWQKVAEAQLAVRDGASAQLSYRKALAALDKMASSSVAYWFDIRSILELSRSLVKNGDAVNGRRCLAIAQSLINRIPDTRMGERVRAWAALAESFWKFGAQTAAKGLWVLAYSAAHSYDTKQLHGNMEKARLLTTVAKSISTPA